MQWERAQCLNCHQFSPQIFCYQLAVEAAILDEDFVGPLAGDDHSCEIDSRDVALERRGIAHRATVIRFVQA